MKSTRKMLPVILTLVISLILGCSKQAQKAPPVSRSIPASQHEKIQVHGNFTKTDIESLIKKMSFDSLAIISEITLPDSILQNYTKGVLDTIPTDVAKITTIFLTEQSSDKAGKIYYLVKRKDLWKIYFNSYWEE